jgi:outer membrane protein assembly factor BamB
MRRVLSPVLAIVGLSLTAHADWPQWRGPTRDGRIAGFRAPERWPQKLVRRWRVEVGAGHSSPVATGNAVFVLTREGESEVVRRLDLATGRQVWRDSYPAPYEMDPAARGHGKGPKSTPAYGDGLLYTLGISGILSCLDAATGKVRWRHDFAEQYRRTSPLYGAAMSPLLDRGLLIAHVGGHDGGALTAFDARTGRARWRWTGDGPAYASPIVVNLDGARQVVTQTQKSCAGVAADTGALLWRIPFTTPYDQNCVTPVAVPGQRQAGPWLVFGGTGQPTFACRIQHRDAGGKSAPRVVAEKAWETREVTLYMSTPIADGRRIYGMSERRRGQLFCLDASTGRVEWVGAGRFGENAAFLDAGSALLVLTTDGVLHVMRKNGAALAEVARYPVADSPTWASPAVIGNRVLIKDVTGLTMWDVGS